MARYIPQKGDFVTLSFDPQSGHEQKGRRPALVISNTLFNKHTGLIMACPVTNSKRDYPFHIPAACSNVTGFVMVEQVKSLDYRARKVRRISTAPQALLDEVLSILDACLY